VSGGGSLLVAIHDVEPATFDRCTHIRAWLADRGVERATLLVIPAADLHPFGDRRPDLTQWLRARAGDGDAIAQHGLRHRQVARATAPRQLLARVQGGRAAEFVGLGEEDTRRAVRSGRRLLRLAGIDPHGFVAPAYAYTPALRAELSASFDWWAGLWRVWRGERGSFTPALGLGTSTSLKRALSPGFVRAGARVANGTMRLDLHPADFDHPRHVLALDAALRRAAPRRTITYDDLA
jgi:predicted deacetylase